MIGESLKEIGNFISQRRKQMGRTQKELADFLAISVQDVNLAEEGNPISVELYLRICQALELKPFIVPLEECKLPSSSKESLEPKFLMSADFKSGNAYILHRQYPACLIEVVQTTPATFKIVDLYEDNVSEEELVTHPFLEEAKIFMRDQMAQ